MSIWSLAVIIDRALYFSAARKQSREFAPKVAGALKEGRLDEAIKVADRSKKSHLAEVVTAGLHGVPFSFGSGGAITEEQVESSKRALERSESIVHAKLKKGLGGLATIGSTAPFIGLFGTVVGILNAFQAIATQKTSGIGAVAGGISEALVTTAFGLLVAIPAVMTFNYFTNKVEAFDVEMDNSSSELVDYFIKQSPPLNCWRLAAERCTHYLARITARQVPDAEANGVRSLSLAGSSQSRIQPDRRASRQPDGADLMAISKREEGKKVNSNINVTPMVDVMLVLLIIFMVITPMLNNKVNVDLPKVSAATVMENANKEDAITVAVTRDGKIFLGGDQVSLDRSWRARCRAAEARRRTRQPTRRSICAPTIAPTTAR